MHREPVRVLPDQELMRSVGCQVAQQQHGLFFVVGLCRHAAQGRALANEALSKDRDRHRFKRRRRSAFKDSRERVLPRRDFGAAVDSGVTDDREAIRRFGL